jgi:hypothetical protein
MLVMAQPAKSPTTVYLDPRIAKAAKVKAAVSDRSLSDLVNEGLARLLNEDAQILQMVKSRRREKPRDYDRVLEELRADGVI